MNTPALTEELIRASLRGVIDPEIDCNIVDLGLIYDLAIDGSRVGVTMTLTTPGCPMHQSIAWGVQNALLQVPGISEVNVDVVWDPPWDPSMMSPETRVHLGMR